jgi:hypothetical protein
VASTLLPRPLTDYPYRPWVGLTKQERWSLMFDIGYNPGSGQRLGDKGTCGGCRWLRRDERVTAFGNPYNTYRCALPVLPGTLPGRQVRKKWPGCRSFAPAEVHDVQTDLV